MKKPAPSSLDKAMQNVWGKELEHQLKLSAVWALSKPDTRNRYQKWRDKTVRKFWGKMHAIVEKHHACDNYY